MSSPTNAPTSRRAVAGGFDASIVDTPRRWTVPLGDDLVAGLVDAGRRLADRPLAAITLADEHLEAADEYAEGVLTAVSRSAGGPGFAISGHLPVREMSEAEVRAAYWVLGLHVGHPVTQNKHGHLLGDVRLTTTGGYRGYNTSKGGRFHSDFTNLGALLSRRRARSGGESAVVSSAHIHDTLLAEQPDLLEVLYRPFALGRLREEREGEAPFSSQPVFAHEGDRFGAFVNHALIVQAQEYPEAGRLTEAQVAADDAIDAITHREGTAFHRMLEEGELFWFNNHQVLHSRTDFEDHEEPDQKRHLLRLWLEVPRLEQEIPAAVSYDYRFGSTGLGPEEVS